jgi:hypothetical protein
VSAALQELQANGAQRFKLRIGEQQALRIRWALRTQVGREPLAAIVVRILEALKDGPCVITVERVPDA